MRGSIIDLSLHQEEGSGPHQPASPGKVDPGTGDAAKDRQRKGNAMTIRQAPEGNLHVGYSATDQLPPAARSTLRCGGGCNRRRCAALEGR